MESEIKNTVYIAIACSLLAIVLGFVMVMINIKDTMASARNEEIIGREIFVKKSVNNDLDCDNSYNTQYYNNLLYIRHPEVYEINTDGETSTITNCPLVEMYAKNSTDASTGVYYAYLVYDNESVTTATRRDFAGNSKVTGIVVEYFGN